jgi:hypothetical protein
MTDTKPLGGKVSRGECSPEHMAELAAFQLFKQELNSCPPVNCETNASIMRQTLARHNKNLIPIFQGLGLMPLGIISLD